MGAIDYPASNRSNLRIERARDWRRDQQKPWPSPRHTSEATLPRMKSCTTCGTPGSRRGGDRVHHAHAVPRRWRDVGHRRLLPVLRRISGRRAPPVAPKRGHAFYVPCIGTWLNAHVNCPLCRTALFWIGQALAIRAHLTTMKKILETVKPEINSRTSNKTCVYKLISATS